MLTQEEARNLFEYRDGTLYWRVNRPHNKRAGKIAGTLNRDGRWSVSVNNKRYLCYRIIFLMHYGHIPEFIDHVNGDPKDNSIENLREATRNQNAHNAKMLRTNTSGVKGVHWHKRKNKWCASVTVNGVAVHVGYFKDIEKAAEAVQAAREKHHGEFARHN